MARTSFLISIAFTGFIMLSIAQMALGVSKVGQVVDAHGPLKAANADRDGTFAANKHGVKDEGKTVLGAAKGSANAYLVGVVGVDSEKGQAKIDGNTGGNVAGVAGLDRGGYLVVDYEKGQVNEKAKTEVNAANGLVRVNTQGSTPKKVEFPQIRILQRRTILTQQSP
ncbi:hypothetical protein C5167_027717 [Papaver somniferum]|uniref:uncharacterized protein LOC113339960 n=1 Tax=Papaver somniferum TaxID=3469 RepID=UPI000E6FA4C8|nr:uncharacterized protein LOC113339960 [Papaver somniferum]RZC91654.1 hypothetical protein C5167_027717 [Papaver somniferum]